MLIRQASQEKIDWAQILSFPEPKQCIDVLGTPVGDPESESQAAEDMVSAQMFNRLRCVQSHQIKLLLLRQCLVTRMSHLSRTLPPESSIRALDKLNAHVESFISEVFEIESINDLKWMEITLPINLGGLNIKDLSIAAQQDYYPLGVRKMVRLIKMVSRILFARA